MDDVASYAFVLVMLGFKFLSCHLLFSSYDFGSLYYGILTAGLWKLACLFVNVRVQCVQYLSLWACMLCLLSLMYVFGDSPRYWFLFCFLGLETLLSGVFLPPLHIYNNDATRNLQQPELEADKDYPPEPYCVVCYSSPPTIRTRPCGHMLYCSECFLKQLIAWKDARKTSARSYGNCPSCRAEIQNFLVVSSCLSMYK